MRASGRHSPAGRGTLPRMAQKVTTRTVCDMPHDDELPDAIPVSITTPDGEWSVDLCTDHAAHFLLPVVAAARKLPRRGRPRTPSPLGQILPT